MSIPFNIEEPFLCYVCGKPRSGKSYLSAYIILTSLEKYTFPIYTDIQGIKPNNEKLFRFNMTAFLAIWNEEMLSFNSKTYGDNHDIIFREKFKALNMLGAMFVIDEVQEFLDVDVKVWKRVFSYYGHYDMKLILITQDLGLVHKRYKTTPDKFLWAVSSGNRFSKSNFLYRWFDNAMMRNGNFYNDLITDFKIPLDKKVFSFYNSGSKVNKKSNLPKIIKLAIFPIILMLLAGIFLYYKIAPSSADIANVDKSSLVKPSLDISSSKLNNIRFNSVSSSDNTSSLSYLFVNAIYFHNKILYFYLISNPSLKFPVSFLVDNSSKHYSYASTFVFVVSSDFFNSLQGVQNEKNNNILSPSN